MLKNTLISYFKYDEARTTPKIWGGGSWQEDKWRPTYQKFKYLKVVTQARECYLKYSLFFLKTGRPDVN